MTDMEIETMGGESQKGSVVPATVAAGGKGSAVVAAPTTYFYDRSNFDDRFDGAIDRAAGLVWLVFRFTLVPKEPEWQSNSVIWGQVSRDFGAGFKASVERIWAVRRGLKPACPVDKNLSYGVRVSVDVDDQKPHTVIHLFKDKAGGRSNVNRQRDDRGRVTASLQESDNLIRTKSATYQGKELTFQGSTSAHEFGHMIGLPHILCDGADEICYGATPDQMADVMGHGSVISPADLEPFKRIAVRHGNDVFSASIRSGCNHWSVVDDDR